MSIAGVWGGSKEQRARDALASLGRLAYAGAAPAMLLQNSEATLGVVNASAHWRGDGMMAVFDGVLYERAELQRQLDLPGTANDAEITCRAQARWGEEFPQHMDGEYAFGLWDGAQQQLILGRDAMSRVPLFLSELPDGYCFASEPRGLRGWPGVDDRLDDESLARILSQQHKHGLTLFRGIRALAGGETLQLRKAHPPKSVPYWHPLRQPELHLRDWREYAEALHYAMVRAVERRLPATGLVGAQMSSGFDSSGVSALAAKALARQNRPLVAYTAVPVHRTNAREILNDRFDNEWPLASQVAAMYPNMEHVAIPNDAADWWQAIDTMCENAGGPPGFLRNSRWYHAILQDAQHRGLVTMLEGQAGNLTGSYSAGFGLYDLRKKRRWSELIQAVRNRRRQGTAWKTMANAAWMPSAKARARLQRLRRKPMLKLFEMTMMNPDFYRGSGLEQLEYSQLGLVLEGDRSSGRAWRHSLLSMADTGMIHAMQMRAFGLRREDPTADRALVELCLSIPDEAFAPNGIKRELYREAFRSDLPAELLSEPLRGLQASDFLLLFEEWLPEWRAEMDRLETSSVGRYLDLPRMRGTLDDWDKWKTRPRAAADIMYNYTFGGALALGRFLRRLEANEI